METTEAGMATSSWRSYLVEVQVYGETSYVRNGQRWPTFASAHTAGDSLFMRWFSVENWRVVGSEEEPNQK